VTGPASAVLCGHGEVGQEVSLRPDRRCQPMTFRVAVLAALAEHGTPRRAWDPSARPTLSALTQTPFTLPLETIRFRVTLSLPPNATEIP
jgi:hypothetical protein